MDIVIIAIGDELLSGRTVDTNSAWLSANLDSMGIRTLERLTVADEIPAIIEALRRVKSRVKVCIITGGLGPTNDDLTVDALAKFAERKLVASKESLDIVLEKYRRRGLIVPVGGVPREALLPEGATPLDNAVGVAPGILMELDDFTIIALPGVPHEMKDIFERSVSGHLANFERGARAKVESIFTTGIPESRLFGVLEPVIDSFPDAKIAFYPSFYGVEIRLTGEVADARFRKFREAVREKASPWCYSTNEGSLPAIIGEILSLRGLNLSVAESCTGGLIASRLVDVPGASRWFEGGVVSYSNDAKIELLGVDRSVIEDYGAVSGIVAGQMARGAAERFHTKFALSTTGIAGPSGGTPEKPVGLVFYALHSPEGTKVRSNIIAGPREAHRHRTSQAVLTMLWLELDGKYDNHQWADGSREFKL